MLAPYGRLSVLLEVSQNHDTTLSANILASLRGSTASRVLTRVQALTVRTEPYADTFLDGHTKRRAPVS